MIEREVPLNIISTLLSLIHSHPGILVPSLFVAHTKYVPSPFSNLVCMSHFIQVSVQSHPREAYPQLLCILFLYCIKILFIYGIPSF